MPAIRDEEWFYSPSFKEGIQALDKGEKSVRFSGLLLGQDAADGDSLAPLFDAIRTTASKSVCIDWFDVKTDSFKLITSLAADDVKYKLDSFHLTMIDLGSDSTRLEAVCSIIRTNKPITDLILTFCRIDDSSVKLLASALEANRQILSLNINFNLLKKAGYLTLGASLVKNNTLRYLEAKLNKAEKADLIAFVASLEANTTIEFLDLGQADDIDGTILQNNVPEKLPEKKKQSVKKSVLKEKAVVTKDAASATSTAAQPETATAVAPPPAADGGNTNGPQNEDLFTQVQDFVSRNKSQRKSAEKELKVNQLRDILQNETKDIRASLKHCKILMLGDRGSGKTFFAHCLVHQLYESDKRKLDKLSFARVTELGWTKISQFRHVDMILAKRISTLPLNIENRNKANEVCFQFPEQVVITNKDLMAPSLLANEDQQLLDQLELRREEGTEPNRVFTETEEGAIVQRFRDSMDDTIDKALRENNYPSFSIWDVDSPPGFEQVFRFFFNNHGMIFVFFSLEDVKRNPEKVKSSILKYLKPVDVARADRKDFTSKIFLVGTFLDAVINQGNDEILKAKVVEYEKLEKMDIVTDKTKNGHFDFLLNNGLSEDDTKVIENVRKMLIAFNVDLLDTVGKKYPEIVHNDDDNLAFFALGNNLPKMCENFKHDFDDISGINKFRKKVRGLLDSGKIEVINIMKSLRDAKIIDQLVARKLTKPANNNDFSHQYLTHHEFETLAEKAGITSRADIAILLRYLDVTGVVSWLNGSQTLQNVIVLDPDYVLNGLSKFYEAFGDDGEKFMKSLEEEAKDTGLIADVKNALEKRVVTHDLLLEKLLFRDNFEYFKEFLKHAFFLNKLNIHVLDTVFKRQHNLYKVDGADTGKVSEKKDTAVIDEIYLVPYFSGPSEKEKNVKGIFSSYKAKFVPSSGLFLKGTFERAFASLLDSMNNTVMEEKLKQTANALDYRKHFAELRFGKDIFTVAQLYGDSPLEKEGYLSFEFNSESSVENFLDFIGRVLRKLEGEFIDGGSFNGFVYHDNDWIAINTAREKKLPPYFSKDVKKISYDDILANINNI